MSDLESEVQRRGLIKVSAEHEKIENPFRRVAKFLYLVGEEQAAKVLQKLSRDQIEKVVAEMLTIRYVNKDEAAYILSEFTALYNEAKNSIGGIDTAEGILTKAFGAAKAQEIIERAVPPAPEKPFDFLDAIDGETLSRVLSDELPSTQALVLSQVAPKIAAAYITSLSVDEKKEIVLRLARLEKINPEVLRTVSHSIREKVQRIQAGAADIVDGRAVLASILRRTENTTGEFILQHLADQSPEIERDIRDRLFTIEDVIYADDLFLQKKLSAMQDSDIAALVSHKPSDFINKIFANLSRNRTAFILEEQRSNPPAIRTCKEVTNTFLTYLRKNWESGNLIVRGKDEDDVWIT